MGKGFCFIEFNCKEAATQAVNIFNNCIPEELTNASHKNYVGIADKVCQLNVMTKETWKTFKQEARLIREEIARLNSSEMFATGEKASYEGFSRGTLLKMSHNLASDLLNKQNLKQALGHFALVAYLDIYGKGAT